MICILLAPMISRETELHTYDSEELLPPGEPIPAWLKATINIQVLVNFFCKVGKLNAALYQEVQEQLTLDRQWEQLICVPGLPKSLNAEALREKIILLVKLVKGRILNCQLDVVVLPSTEKEDQ